MTIDQDDPRIRNVVPLLTYGDALASAGLGYRPMDAEAFIGAVAQFDWRETFVKLARLAAILANGTASASRALTTDLIASFENSSHNVERVLARYVRDAESRRPIASEASIYFLQAMALLYGSENARIPPDGTLAFWFLIANDHVLEWRSADSRDLTVEERLVANVTRAMGFNRPHGDLRQFVRMVLTLKTAPPRAPQWQEMSQWEAFLAGAFDMRFDEFIEGLAAPLVMQSVLWGRDDEEVDSHLPIIDPSKWLVATQVDPSRGAAFLKSLSMDRASATAELKNGLPTHGLPIGPSIFYRFPLVQVRDDRLVAASPWVVAEQLRGALWGKCLQHAKQLDKVNGAQQWLSAFGDLFETYCRSHAERLRTTPRPREKVHMGSGIGDESEIEDIIISDANSAVLISIKASTIPESKLKQAKAQSDVVDWFEQWLFGAPTQTHRAGVIHQLNAKVDRAFRGEFEPTVKRNFHVYPVVVAYDDFGIGNSSLYRWLDGRCKSLGLLQQRRVARLTFLSIGDLEALLALASAGDRIIPLLRKKTNDPKLAESTMSSVLSSQYDDSLLRFGDLEQEFQQLTERLTKRLFARSLRDDEG